MVWGGRKLASVLNLSLPTEESFGEAWLISDHPTHHSESRFGSLRQLMLSDSRSLLGDSMTQFPWLVKYLDAQDWLSVQVHPNEQDVQRLWPGENSKTEAWFILDAEPASRIYAGLKPGVQKHHLRAALAEGSVPDYLHSFQPQPGQCVYLPAGTVHAVGGGVLIAEIQQTSDATFRLFDWNRVDSQGRSRTLHIEEAFACIDWEAGPVHPITIESYSGSMALWQELVRCRYFHLDYIRQREVFCLPTGQMQVAIVLHGEGEMVCESGRESLRSGDTLLLPASLPTTRILPRGRFGLLLATLPESLSSRRAA